MLVVVNLFFKNCIITTVMRRKILCIITLFFTNTTFCQQTKWVKDVLYKLCVSTKSLSSQYVVVVSTAEGTFFAKLYAYELKHGKIHPVMEDIDAVIGRNGFAKINSKLEGDGKTPSGIYKLGPVFYQTKTVNTKLDKIKTQDNDYWIDDTNSELYNKWYRGMLPSDVKSYEKMNIPLYKYCIVIQYNTEPVVKGEGSAIFLHLWSSKLSPTAGCVAVSEKNILKLLRWLDKDKNPVIILGTKDTIEKLATQ